MDVINSVLAQKAGLAPASQAEKDEGVVSPTRLMRRAMARAADKSVGLSASVLGISQDDVSGEALIEEAPEGWIVLGLRESGEPGLTGLFLMDPALRSALVEMQTMGCLLPTAQEQRKITGTDASLSMPFATHLMTELDELGFGEGDVKTSNYDFGPMADVRTAGLVLTQGSYRFWRVTIQMGGTDSQGELMIALRKTIDTPLVPVEGDTDWSAAFRKSVAEAPTDMEAVLARLRLSISEIEAFEVGQVLPLAGVTVGSVTLTGPEGKQIAQARLGQVAGKRAVRIQDHVMEMQDTSPAYSDSAASPTRSDDTLIDG